MDRREFVAASGLVAIAGCLARGNENDDGGDGDPVDEDGLPESLTTVLDPVPSNVDDSELRYLYVVAPGPDGSTDQGVTLYDVEHLGLDDDSVDRMATGIYGQYAGRVNVVSGEFDANDVDVQGRISTSTEDGFAVTARSSSGPWEDAIEAAETAAEDPDIGIDGTLPIETLFEPLIDVDMAVAIPDLDAETISQQLSIDTDAVEAIAMGRTADVEAREQTVTYVAAFADGESPDEAVIEELLEADNDDGEIEPDDVDIETGDDRATTTFTRELPQSELPDNSPDVRVHVLSSFEGDATTLRVTGEESVDASNLEYRIDGESAEPPWDEGATLEDGDRFEIDVPPMTHVAVLWIDPELEDVEQPLGQTVVGGQDAFTGTYDHDANELTVEYTADRTLDADRFTIVQWAPGGNEETRPLTDYVDSLEAGTRIVLSDAEYGEYVRIEMEVDDGTEDGTQSVFTYSVNPPGYVDFEQENGERALVYRGDTDATAEHFQVLVNDEPAPTQWSDVAETLTDGERLELDLEVGDSVTVEYQRDGDSVEVLSQEILPDTEFSFDVGDSDVEITHDGGAPVDAEKLSLELYPSQERSYDDAFAESYDTVEEGDSITVEYSVDGDDAESVQWIAVEYDGQTLDHHVVPPENDGSAESDSGTGSDGGSDEGTEDE